MSYQLVVAFLVLSVSLIMVPGMDWAYTVSASTQKASMPAIIGILLGYLLITVLVSIGLGAIIANVPYLLEILMVVGSLYLLWLGVQNIRHPSLGLQTLENQSRSWQAWCLQGCMVSGLNPKGLLLFLALLPQFTSRSASLPLSVQMLVLGMIFIVSCGVFYSLVGVLTGKVLAMNTNASRYLSYFSGISMVAVAGFILWELGQKSGRL